MGSGAEIVPEPEPADAGGVDAVLDGLPDALLASSRAEQDRLAEQEHLAEQERLQAAAAVLDAIPDGLIASYREDRERVRLAA